MKGLIWTCVIALLIGVGMISSCKRIDAGHTGIKFNHYGITDDRGVSDKEVVSGMVWFWPPTQSIYEYPHFWQQVTYEDICFNSIEGEPICCDLAVVYRFGRESIAETFDEYRESPKELRDGIVREITLKSLNNRAGDLQAVDIMGRLRDDLLIAVAEDLNENYSPNFEFDMVNFSTDLKPSENVKSAIQGVIQAQEAAKKAQAATIEVEEQVRQKIMRAKGDSTSRVVAAAGEAQAIQLIQKQIATSTEYIDYVKAKNWDGKLPQVTGEVIPMINIGGQ